MRKKQYLIENNNAKMKVSYCENNKLSSARDGKNIPTKSLFNVKYLCIIVYEREGGLK